MNTCIKCHEEPAVYCAGCHGILRMLIERKFKKRVWKKANNTCEMCGETNKDCLNVHHEMKEDHPFDESKARLLCFNCHFGKIHKLKRDD